MDAWLRGYYTLVGGMYDKAYRFGGMRDESKNGCGIQILRWERDFLNFIRGIRDSFKIDGGMRDENRTRWDRKEHSDCGGIKLTSRQDVGLKKSMFVPLLKQV